MQIQNQTSSKQTPASQGFHMPAEWAPHEATWLAWPHNEETWPGKHLAVVEEIYLQMLEGLLPGEKVHLLVSASKEEEKVVNRLRQMKIAIKNLIFHRVPTADVWIRDYGPTFVTDGKGHKAWNKWIFNAWGAKYESLMEDNQVFSATLQGGSAKYSGGDDNASLIPHPRFKADIVLEGGSIEVNGAGTCLVTEQCLLNPNRNPKFSREKIEEVLKNHLGVSQILWLGKGIAGDDTDGHIDDIVRFVSENTLVSAYEDDTHDENHGPLNENWERLERMRNLKDRPWNLIKFPMPGKVANGQARLPASYANFYIANGVVLLPVFKHKNDERAVKILKEIFPKREIIPINCTDLVYGLGAIHCVTQQEPA